MRHAFLALLSDAPAHGYEIKLALDELFGALWPPLNAGQIYTTLARLERDGLVESVEVEQDSRPNKRVYRLTESGRRALLGWLWETSQPTPPRSDLLLRILLARRTGLTDVRTLIDQQRTTYLLALRRLHELADGAAGDPIELLLVEGAMLHFEADLHWLELCDERFGLNGVAG